MQRLRNRLGIWLAMIAVLILCAGCDPSGSDSGSNSGVVSVTSKGGASSLLPSPGSRGTTATNVAGSALPQLDSKPKPVTGTYQGCPPVGDGGDSQLNILKNRTDSAQWNPVSVISILSLRWPQGIQMKKRASWSQSDAAEIARSEGTPVQIEGWLAGAKQEGPESPNCHAADDVDNHLWIVDDPSKDRSKSVVVEITPRIRASHPGWAFERVSPLVDGRTKVRISGWLMMDQEHPDQVGKTRGTIWEIHPIMAFEVLRANNWVALDQGRVVSGPGTNASNVPTQAPIPADEQPSDEDNLPTATPLPSSSRIGGRTTASGGVKIDDIAYKGSSGTGETSEYVEISNSSSSEVNLNGWVLRDVYGGQEFTWSNYTLRPGQKIRVYTGEIHPETGGFSFGSRQALWNNKGDAAELLDGSGKVVSSFAYGDKR